MADPRPDSALELVHPTGVSTRSCVIAVGDAHGAGGARPAGPFELIVLGSPGARTGRPVSTDLRFLVTALAPDGMAYVLAPRFGRARLRRRIAQVGLRIEHELVHLPRATGTFLTPLERAPLRFTLTELMLLPAWKERAAVVLASRRRAVRVAAAPLGFVVRRRDARTPSWSWLARLAGAPVATAIVTRTRPHGHGHFVVHGFRAGEERPSLVAKVVPASAPTFDREQRALAALGPGARAAGARVPAVLASGVVGDARVLLLDALPGRLAATALARSPHLLHDVLERLAAWLLEWGRRTLRKVTLTRELCEEHVLQPARLLAPHVAGGPDYLAQLERLCDDAAGREVAAVATHNDLTMWNVLVEAGGPIGVVDWEEATEPGLPLVDFYYAALDAAAATRGYVDRPRAFADVFGSAGPLADSAARLAARIARGVGTDATSATVAFHACWLRHAANELHRRGAGGPRPFARIVELVAAGEARCPPLVPAPSTVRGSPTA